MDISLEQVNWLIERLSTLRKDTKISAEQLRREFGREFPFSSKNPDTQKRHIRAVKLEALKRHLIGSIGGYYTITTLKDLARHVDNRRNTGASYYDEAERLERLRFQLPPDPLADVNFGFSKKKKG